MTRTILSSFAAGILGFVLMFGGWHLYQDHANLHAMLNFLNAQIAAQQKAQAAQSAVK